MTSTKSTNKLFGNKSNATVSQPNAKTNKNIQHDINCLNFSKLSISSPRSSRKDLKNSGQTMPTETSSYRPLLPRIEFPSAQFDRLLRMDTKDMKNNWKSNDTKKNTK